MDNFPSIQTILDEFIQHISEQPPVSAADLPNIDLYMDQVTSFMDDHLEHSKRYPEDKILTKTMINNYAKNHLLPPPEKFSVLIRIVAGCPRRCVWTAPVLHS